MLFSNFPKTPNKQQQLHGLMQYKETRVELHLTQDRVSWHTWLFMVRHDQQPNPCRIETHS
jgi:hypothetical protein